MSHRNARLTPFGRQLLIQRVLKERYTVAQAAASLGISRTSGYKWMRRYHAEGLAGLADRGSRPYRSPRALPASRVNEICQLRRELGRGPLHLGWLLQLPPSTVYGVLRRAGLHRLDRLDRLTRIVVRYEKDRPGALLHLDVKKLWRIPPGGGRRPILTPEGGVSIPRQGKRGHGYDLLHVAIDDYSRYLYAELLPDQTGATTADFLARATTHFARLGVRVESLLTDNALNYRSTRFRQCADERGIRLKRTRPYRPQTNGKAERVIQTLLHEWAYRRPYARNEDRLHALLVFLEEYNRTRPHTALGRRPPITRICQ